MRPFILLTNDDGIDAPGIKHLWEAVHEYADVAIVAPIAEKSGSGVSITQGKPLKIYEIEWEKNTPAWTLTGTPADCVKMALSVLLDRKPDLVLSGINMGHNSGRTVLYSGTIGGVIEASFKGVPGIAFSFDFNERPTVSITKKYILSLIEHISSNPLPPHTVLNVNFPKTAIRGCKFAIQGKGQWTEEPDKRIHPGGRPYYWLGGRWSECEEDPESDVALLNQGYITVVPLQVGHLTHAEFYHTHKDLEWE